MMVTRDKLVAMDRFGLKFGDLEKQEIVFKNSQEYH
jgi:hypothetical protein